MIKFTTINIDGNEVSRQFNTIEEVLTDWWSEEGTTLPSADDEVISFMIDGKDAGFLCNVQNFEDIIEELSFRYWNELGKLKA